METQIKEEAHEDSLCFETSGDDLANLSFVEKYDRFVRAEHSDIDSDGEFFPDDNLLRQEYAQLTGDATNYQRAKFHRRLSTGLPGRYGSQDSNCTLDRIVEANNGKTANSEEKSGYSDSKSQEKSRLAELIARLGEIRKCDPDGNSIFCTQEELDTIQERFGDVLDYLHDKSSTFERCSSSKYSDNEEQVDVGNAIPDEQREVMRMLADKIVSVQQVRERFHEVEHQVREQVEQLELVERLLM